MAKFDLGGAVSTHNLLAACNNNNAPNNNNAVGPNVHNTKTTQAVTAAEIYKSQPNLVLGSLGDPVAEDPSTLRIHGSQQQQHRSLLLETASGQRPLVALVMEPASAVGLLTDKYGVGGGNPNSNYGNPSSGDTGSTTTVEASPTTGFKSSFAKEFARGRKASAVTQERYGNACNSYDENPRDYSPPPSPYIRPTARRFSSNLQQKNRIKQQFHEALEADSLMTEEYASSKNIDLDDEDVDLEEGDGCEADLWMTSTQFSQLLDKQEAAETQQPPPTIAPSANSQQKISLAAATEKNNNRASSRYSTMTANSLGYNSLATVPSQPSTVGNHKQLFRRSSIASSVTSGASSAYSRNNNNITLQSSVSSGGHGGGPTLQGQPQNGLAGALGGSHMQQTSYLDNDAKSTFVRLKQSCKDLGLSLSDSEWSQLRQQLLLSSAAVVSPGEQLSTAGSAPDGDPDQLVVRNGDFFSAAEVLVKNRRRVNSHIIHQESGETTDILHRHHNNHRHHHHNHKYSMKSDSGGEMESCRSSDSESGGGLQDSTLGGSSTSTGSSPSPSSSDLASSSSDAGAGGHASSTPSAAAAAAMADTLAEKETELVRLKLEVRRLQEANATLIQGGVAVGRDKRTLELEKEVDHLKWQLSAMETSRRTYEEATNRLVTFLEQVTSVLQGGGGSQASNPVQRKLMESTRAEISRVARRAKIQNKRLSLDSQSIISRTESMPGLNFGLNGSLLSINTTASQKEASSGGVHHHGGGRGRSEASKGHPPRRDSSVGGSSSRSGQSGHGGHSATANRLSAIASLTGSTRTLAAATVTPGGAPGANGNTSSSSSGGGGSTSSSSSSSSSSASSASSSSASAAGKERHTCSKIQRSQSSHGKLPSVQETPAHLQQQLQQPQAPSVRSTENPLESVSGKPVRSSPKHDYVNAEIISNYSQEQKKHVCAIRIGGGGGSESGNKNEDKTVTPPAAVAAPPRDSGLVHATAAQIEAPPRNFSKTHQQQQPSKVIISKNINTNNQKTNSNDGSSTKKASKEEQPGITAPVRRSSSRGERKNFRRSAVSESEPPIRVLSSDPSSDLSDSRAPGISQATTAAPPTQAAGNKMQVLVASNSNKPSRQSSYSRASTEGNLTTGGGVANNKDNIRSGITPEGSEGSNNLQNQTKFKSLGDLHMEKGLPSAPRYAASTAVSSAHRRLSKLFKLSSSSSSSSNTTSKKRTSSYYVTDNL